MVKQRSCKPCGFYTYCKNDFRRHLNTIKHKINCPEDDKKLSENIIIPTTVINPTVEKEISGKFYLCGECHQEFPSIIALDNHNTSCELKVLRAKNKELQLLNEKNTLEIQRLKEKNHTEVSTLKEKISKLEEDSNGLTDENKNLQKEIKDFMKKILNIEISNKKNKPGQRKSLPKAMRDAVWEEYIGEEKLKGLCYVCGKCEIKATNFECAHVISVYNGGEDTLENLRPSCSTCNLSMGTQDLEEFKASLLEFKTKKAKDLK